MAGGRLGDTRLGSPPILPRAPILWVERKMALWAIQVRGWSGLSSGWTWLPPSPPSPPSPPPALPALPGPSKAPAITAPTLRSSWP